MTSAAVRRGLGIAVLVALVLRLLFALAYWVDKPLTVDEIDYLTLSERLAGGDGLSYPEGAPHRMMRSPGYPVFLAAVGAMAPGHYVIRIAQCVLGALSVLLVGAMAHRLSGPRAAVAGTFAAAVYPPLVFKPAYLLSETLYTALAFGTALLAWQALDGPAGARRRRVALAGAIGGLTFLVRPEFALFLGAIGLSLVWRREWTTAFVLAAATVVTIAPWPLYNMVTPDARVPMRSRGGLNFWIGNNPLAVGDGDLGSNPQMSEAFEAIAAASAGLSPEATDGVFYRRALTFIREEPFDWTVLLLKKVFWFFVPFGPSYRARSLAFWVTHATSWLVLLGVSAAAWRRLPTLRPPPLVPTALAASVFATCVIFFPLERYRVPLLDPVLIAYAATLAGASRLEPEADAGGAIPGRRAGER